MLLNLPHNFPSIESIIEDVDWLTPQEIKSMIKNKHCIYLFINYLIIKDIDFSATCNIDLIRIVFFNENKLLNRVPKLLLDTKILILRENYYVGKKSKRYGININLFNKGLDKIIIENKLEEKYKNNWKKYKIRMERKYKMKNEYENKYKKVLNNINNNLEYLVFEKSLIDITKDIINKEYINIFIDNNIEDLNELHENLNNNIKLEIDKLSEKLIRCQTCYDNVMDKQYNTTISPNNGRIYNQITRMPSLLRKELKHSNGSKLYEVDISNSQPLLLSKLLEQTSYNGCKDLIKFKELCENGDFYNELINIFGYSKGDIKKKVFSNIMFCNSRVSEFSDFTNKIGEKYPDLIKAIVEFKKNNDKPANLLQAIESDLIINQIGHILVEKNIWFLTIHDSFLVQEKDIVIVNNITKEIFKKNGLCPNISTK